MITVHCYLWLYRFNRGRDDVLHTLYAATETEAWAQVEVWKQTVTDPILSEALPLASHGWGWFDTFERSTVLCLPDGASPEGPGPRQRSKRMVQ